MEEELYLPKIFNRATNTPLQSSAFFNSGIVTFVPSKCIYSCRGCQMDGNQLAIFAA
jgi:hypothetical protein